MRLSFLLIILMSQFGCTDSPPDVRAIRIAAAANLRYALNDISIEFTKETGIPCEIIFGSSGKLYAQIRTGAPFDYFLSADVIYPEKLFIEGLGVNEPEIFAYGKLVLWSTIQDVPIFPHSLTDKRIKHIALPNPESAPYGKAAQEVLINLGLYDIIKKQLVVGESVMQTDQYVLSGTAELGFTSMSSAINAKGHHSIRYVEVEKDLYSPIEQGGIRISDINESARFHQFLQSDKCHEILERSGYELPYKTQMND